MVAPALLPVTVAVCPVVGKGTLRALAAENASLGGVIWASVRPATRTTVEATRKAASVVVQSFAQALDGLLAIMILAPLLI